MASAIGDGGLVNIAVMKKRREGALTAGAAAEDSHAREIHFRMPRGGGAHPGDAVGKTRVT